MTDFNPGYLLNAVIYSATGLVLFAAAFAVVTRMLPGDVWKELVENRNTAVAIVAGAMILGVSIIIASTVH
ncbi:MAG TPA: DUF350 domain-containing protein [Bryobacteraceae bacterium]|nr:DUF350 domain-containing protein [Bryobacteraceae bacterium]